MESGDLIKVKVQKLLRAKRWQVLRMITRVNEFPLYMPNVKQATILERSRRGAVTQWQVNLEGIPLSWKERDEFDFANFTIRFKAIEGDLEHFEGKWVLSEHPSGATEVTVEVEARIGIPLVDKVVGDTVREKLDKNFELMLTILAERVTMLRYKKISDRCRSDIHGFAVIGHPYNLKHLIKYFKFFRPDFKLPSDEFLLKIFEITPSYRSYDIKNFRSTTGKETHGYFVMCPIIPDMLTLKPEKVVEKVGQACRVAEGLGVGIVSLGGFASIAGEKYGKILSTFANVPLTTGNSLTVGMTLEGVAKACQMMDIDLAQAKVTVIGGTGDIGGACARLLAEKVSAITITGRDEKNLMDTERVLAYAGRARIRTSRNNNEAVRGADVVIAAASASSSIVDFASFKPGAVICDVGYPKNISYTMCHRDDILIFSGGLTRLPSDFDLGFDIGLPSTRIMYGCFAEAIILDLEERYENFSWGKGNISEDRVHLIMQMAKKHGFELAPLFWGIRLMSDAAVEKIKKNVKAGVRGNVVKNVG